MIEVKPITGVLVNYYFICKRKLWLFAYDIRMEHTSETVAMGKLIDETTFTRRKKGINIDDVVNIDFFAFPGYISEVKKSDVMSEADEWQIKYYIYYLKKKGVEVKGILHYPKLKKRKVVELTEEDEIQLEEILQNIEEILKMKVPPAPVKQKGVCRKCSYFEMCFI